MRIQLRHDSTSNWESYNPILSAGEIGVDVTNGKLKAGNGTSTWLELDYIGSVDLSSYATKTEVNAEALARQQADNGLQTQLNALPTTYVNLSSSQTVTGRKTFSGDIKTDRIYGATTNDTLLRDNNHTVNVGDTTNTSKMIINGTTSIALNTPSLFQNNNGSNKKILTEADIATTSAPGIVQPDGTTITINNGVISGASTYTLPTASTNTLGGVKIDGTTIAIDSNGVISSTGSAPSNMVTTDTAQTISGQKTFTSGIIAPSISGGNSSTPFYIYNGVGDTCIRLNGNGTCLFGNATSNTTIATNGYLTISRNYDDYVNLDTGNISTCIDGSSITTNAGGLFQTVGVIDNGNAYKFKEITSANYETLVNNNQTDPHTYYNITDDSDTTLTILNLLYPVGSIYIGTMNTCPLATLGIGTWQLVASDRVLQGSGTRGSAGNTVNESLPNIKGSANLGDGGNGGAILYNPTGAFYNLPARNQYYIPSNTLASNTWDIGFDASGSSSTYQNNAPVQQDAYIVNIWERTA